MADPAPQTGTEADRLARAHNEDCIEDCVYYGFESAIPQITSEMFGDMLEFDTLNKAGGTHCGDVGYGAGDL